MLAAYVVRTLEYLSKGGRIGKVEGIVGTLLRICPVISVNDDGVYYPMSKTVGYRKSLESMKKEFKMCIRDSHWAPPWACPGEPPSSSL